MKENFKSFGDLAKQRITAKTKAPAYQWQDLALKVIKELNVPANKRSSVFRVCKQYNRQIVERAMNDTKELCKSGEQWRYFFKIIDKKPDDPAIQEKNRAKFIQTVKRTAKISRTTEANSPIPF